MRHIFRALRIAFYCGPDFRRGRYRNCISLYVGLRSLYSGLAMAGDVSACGGGAGVTNHRTCYFYTNFWSAVDENYVEPTSSCSRADYVRDFCQK